MEARHQTRLQTKGGSLTKSCILFLMRTCFENGVSSYTARIALCHSVYRERAEERGEARVQAGRVSEKIMAGVQLTRGKSLNQDGEKKRLISKVIYIIYKGKEFVSIIDF